MMSNIERRLTALEANSPAALVDPVAIIWLTGPDGIPPTADSCLIAGRNAAEVEKYTAWARQDYERKYNK